MTVHVSQNSGNNEWYTPPQIIEAAREVMGAIDLDPASSDVANTVVGATRYYTALDDGLDKPWGGRVWMNPPYARGLVNLFVAKLLQHFELNEVTEAVVLTNNATETLWYQPLATSASAVCLLRGRIKFLTPQLEPQAKPLQGQVITYLGDDPSLFKEKFSGLGPVFGRCL